MFSYFFRRYRSDICQRIAQCQSEISDSKFEESEGSVSGAVSTIASTAANVATEAAEKAVKKKMDEFFKAENADENSEAPEATKITQK